VNRAAAKAIEKRKKTRDRLWPDAEAVVFDPEDQATKGYARVPRVVPLVARLIDEIGGKNKAGRLYQALWAHDWGQSLVEPHFKVLLYEAGYSVRGKRTERTWQERLDVLLDLKLIRTARRGVDDHGHVLLLDPHLAVLELQGTADRRDKHAQGVLAEWMPQFESFCETWSIDLAKYRLRCAELGVKQPEAAQ